MAVVSTVRSAILSLLTPSLLLLFNFSIATGETRPFINLQQGGSQHDQVSLSTSTSNLASIIDQTVNFHIRDAQLSDLDDVTSVLAAAFAGSRAWDYGYQFREEYPEYHWYCLRERLRQGFVERDVDKVWVRVGEVETVSGLDGCKRSRRNRGIARDSSWKERRVVSVSIWKVMDQNEPEYWDTSDLRESVFSNIANTGATNDGEGHRGPQFDCSSHLDMNVTRMQSFREQYQKLRRPYIDDAYLKQLHLEELATHPDFRGRGYAAELVRRGIKEARNRELGPVTLLSTPAGYEFYRELGFVDLGEVLIPRLDGTDDLWFEAMRWKW